MDNAETESDYIVIDGAIIDAAYIKRLGSPVGAVRQLVRRLTVSDKRIVEHLQSLEMSVSAAWEFLRRLGKRPGLGTQIEASVLDSLLSGLANAKRPDRRKKRGRKKPGSQTVEREAKIFDDWQQARDAGVYKGNFARDKKMSVKDLDRLLDRVAKRRQRKGKNPSDK